MLKACKLLVSWEWEEEQIVRVQGRKGRELEFELLIYSFWGPQILLPKGWRLLKARKVIQGLGESEDANLSQRLESLEHGRHRQGP